MENLEKLTRIQLSKMLVDIQIKRGIIKEENRAICAKRYLNGFGYVKAYRKNDFINAIKVITEA